MVVLVPVPDNTAAAKLLVTAGRAKYDATKKALVWKISKFIGSTEHTLRAEVTLVAPTREKKSWGRPPIQVQFQVIITTIPTRQNGALESLEYSDRYRCGGVGLTVRRELVLLPATHQTTAR